MPTRKPVAALSVFWMTISVCFAPWQKGIVVAQALYRTSYKLSNNKHALPATGAATARLCIEKDC
jgi:hypothetical protein